MKKDKWEKINERKDKWDKRGGGIFINHFSPIWMHEVSGCLAAYSIESIDGQLYTVNNQS